MGYKQDRHAGCLFQAQEAISTTFAGVMLAGASVADGEPMYRAQKAPKEVGPLDRAFAHNDYWHPRPLFDALDRGSVFVEVDIFRVGHDLLVGQSADELALNLTLEGLYLDPLLERLREYGQVHPDGPTTFGLMIDICRDLEALQEAELLLNGETYLLRTQPRWTCHDLLRAAAHPAPIAPGNPTGNWRPWCQNHPCASQTPANKAF